MKYLKLIGLSVLMVFILSGLSGVGNAAIPPADEYIYQDTDGDTDTLDPAVAYDSRSGRVIEKAYDTLLTYDGASTDLVPNLAKEMPVVTNGAKTITYTLREDVDFTDGTHFDAYVMKYSIDRAIIMNDPDGPSWMLAQAIKGGADYAFDSDMSLGNVSIYLNAGGVVVKSEYVLEINLDIAYVAIQAALTYSVGAAVSPVAVIDHSAVPDGSDAADEVPMDYLFPDTTGAPDWVTDNTGTGIFPGQQHAWMKANAVGTGPYKVISNVAGEGQVYEYNTNYWKVKAGLMTEPAIKKITYQNVAEAETRLLALKNREIDQVYLPATNMPELYDLETETDKIDGIVTYTYPSFTVMYLGFNMVNNETLLDEIGYTTDGITEAESSTYSDNLASLHQYGEDNPNADATPVASNPFTALEFRQAWAYAFDYDALIETAVNGFGSRMDGFIPKGMFAHQTDLDLPDQDTATAKTLFESVGWEGNVVLTYNAGNDVRKAGATILKNNIEALDVGITVEVVEAEWSSYLDVVRSQKAPIFFLGWAPDYSDPDNYVQPFLHSVGGVLAKRQGYVNTNVDAKIDSAASETDSTAREALYSDIEDMAAKDFAVIYGYQSVNYAVAQNWVVGMEGSFTLNPMASGVDYSVLSKDPDKMTLLPTPGFEFLAIFSVLIAIGLINRKRK
jgi:peptide/nickel transport system substrate-binding protein